MTGATTGTTTGIGTGAGTEGAVLPELARCPNCQGNKFYVEPNGTMVFLHLACDGRAYSTREGHTELAGLDLDRVYCVSCGWHGAPAELAGCQDPEAPRVMGGRD